MAYQPLQKVSTAEKNKSEWQENNIDYFRDTCTNPFTEQEMLEMYQLAAGIFNMESVKYVTNPFGDAVKNRPELKGYPARMRNFDIISPVIQRFMGEKGRRKILSTVINRDSSLDKLKKEKELFLFLKNAERAFINEMNTLGMQTSHDQEPIQTEKEIKKEVEKEVDAAAVQGQDTLDFLEDTIHLEQNFRKGFYHWLATSMVFSYKDVVRDDVVHEIVSCMNMKWLAGENVDYVKNADACSVRYRMTVAQVVDRFRGVKDFKDEIIEDLENKTSSSSTGDTYNAYADYAVGQQHALFENVFGKLPYQNNDLIDVDHVCWTSFKKVGRVTITLVDGTKEILDVSEDFKPAEGETVKWEWIRQVWEGWKLDDRWYVGIQEIPPLFGDRAQLPYNGRVFGTPHAAPVPIPKKGQPYQVEYNIVKYRLEMTLAKNKDKLTFIPYGAVPKEDGWDMFKFMYYGDATGYVFFNESNPQVLKALNAIKVADASLNEYIRHIYAYLQNIIAQWKDSIGFVPQREGQVNASESVGNAREAIFRSTIANEELFKQFEEFEQEDLDGLIKLAQIAYSEGKEASFFKGNGVRQLSIDPDVFPLANLGVHVKNNLEEMERLEQLRGQVAQAYAQNPNIPAKISANILMANSISQVLDDMDEADRLLQEGQAQAQQAEQQAQQLDKQMEMFDKEEERKFKYYKTDEDNETKEVVAMINSDTAIITSAESQAPAESAGTDTNAGVDLDPPKERLERAKIAINKQIADDKNATERRGQDKALEVAKENKNRFDS